MTDNHIHIIQRKRLFFHQGLYYAGDGANSKIIHGMTVHFYFVAVLDVKGPRSAADRVKNHGFKPSVSAVSAGGGGVFKNGGT